MDRLKGEKLRTLVSRKRFQMARAQNQNTRSLALDRTWTNHAAEFPRENRKSSERTQKLAVSKIKLTWKNHDIKKPSRLPAG